MDEVAADADHARDDPAMFDRNRRRTARPAAARREDQIGSAYPESAQGPRHGVSRATSASGCRRCGSPRGTAPSRRCTCTGSTGRRRCCGYCGSAPTHATELPYVWGNLVTGTKDITFKLGGLKPARRCRRDSRSMDELRRGAEPTGPAGEPGVSTRTMTARRFRSTMPTSSSMPGRGNPRGVGRRRRELGSVSSGRLQRPGHPRTDRAGAAEIQNRDCQGAARQAKLVAEVSPLDLAQGSFSDVLPPLMHDPVMFAVPFFLLLLIIEWAAARRLRTSKRRIAHRPVRICQAATPGPASRWAWCPSLPAGC